MEGGTIADGAINPHPPPHQHYQAPADRQAESGAAVLSRRRVVNLAEGLEQPIQSVRRYANARITHGKVKLDRHGRARVGGGNVGRRGESDFDGHVAAGSEFDGIAQKIDQNLAQARHVPDDHRGHGVVHLTAQIDLLFRRAGRQQVERVFDAGADVEGLFLQFEFAGFDFGKVEDVVDDS